MKIVNIWGGPGTGKSTTAAGLFHLMKLKNYNVELVTEFAKDLVWENRISNLEDQLYLLANQHRRVHRLRDHQIDWVITDSPILLNLTYVRDNYFTNFKPLVREIFDSFDNNNFFIERVKEYKKLGRTQTFEQAVGLDHKTRGILDSLGYKYTNIVGDSSAPDNIMKSLGI